MNDKACPTKRDYANPIKNKAQYQLDEIERLIQLSIKLVAELIMGDVEGAEEFRAGYIVDLIQARRLLKSALKKVED